MNERLKAYLARCRPAKVDQKMLDALKREMEAAIPEIVAAIRERERRAAEVRMTPCPLWLGRLGVKEY